MLEVSGQPVLVHACLVQDDLESRGPGEAMARMIRDLEGSKEQSLFSTGQGRVSRMLAMVNLSETRRYEFFTGALQNSPEPELAD